MWVATLGHARVTRVHSPCFHNVAVPVPNEASWLGVAKRHWLAAECTSSSLLVHYMTPELWAAIDANDNLECGNTRCFLH
jgi:hypothetical protein